MRWAGRGGKDQPYQPIAARERVVYLTVPQPQNPRTPELKWLGWKWLRALNDPDHQIQFCSPSLWNTGLPYALVVTMSPQSSLWVPACIDVSVRVCVCVCVYSTLVQTTVFGSIFIAVSELTHHTENEPYKDWLSYASCFDWGLFKGIELKLRRSPWVEYHQVQ